MFQFKKESLVINQKTVEKITITDIVSLKEVLMKFQDIKNGVDALGMDTNEQRNPLEINLNVNMGIIGHVVIDEILKQKGLSSNINFGVDGFYIKVNNKTIKVRSSVGKVPPCPERQVNRFTISGYNTDGRSINDYYVQLIFCGEFDISKENESIIFYIIGCLNKDNLSSQTEYSKQTIKTGDISDSETLDIMITRL